MNKAANTKINPQFCQAILANQSLAVLLFDKNLRLYYLNASAEELLQLSYKSVAGIPAGEIFWGCQNITVELMSQCLVKGESSSGKDELLLRSEPTHINVKFTISYLDSDSEDELIIVELQNIDHQIKVDMEQALLRQTETSRVLLRNLAHEIKNPLGGLRGAAQLLELENPELQEYTSIIIKEADRLKVLVDNMLGPNTLPAIAQLNIHEVLERVRSLLLVENTAELTIARDYDPSIPELTGDFDQLVQVILNVTRNAVIAMDGRGIITYRTRVLRSQMIASKRYRHVVAIDISDNGPGIPAHIKDKLFFPMVSGSKNGMGLGLSIAQRLINQHKGLIEYRSEPGDTQFRILIPLED